MKDRAYRFPTPEHQCCACQGDLSPGGEFYSTICFLEEEFARRNYCVSCWAPEEPGPEEGGEGSGMVDRSGSFADSRTRRPDQQDGDGVKIRFDPLVVLEFFRGLGGRAEAESKVEPGAAAEEAGAPSGPSESQRRDLRFVLSLLLIRKKILLLKGTFIRDKFEWLELQERRESERTYEIANPELSETELEQVRDAIGELLQMQV